MTDKSSWTFNSLRKSIIFAWNANRIKKSKSFQNWEDDEELFEPQKIFSSIGKFQVMLVHILSKQSCPNKILPPHVVFAWKVEEILWGVFVISGGWRKLQNFHPPCIEFLKSQFRNQIIIASLASKHFSIPQIDSPLINQGYRPFVSFDIPFQFSRIVHCLSCLRIQRLPHFVVSISIYAFVNFHQNELITK